MKSKFKIDETVVVLLDDKRIFGTVSAIKEERDVIKYDVSSTFKLYDVLEYFIEKPSERIDLTPM